MDIDNTIPDVNLNLSLITATITHGSIGKSVPPTSTLGILTDTLSPSLNSTASDFAFYHAFCTFYQQHGFDSP